jgi:hypothetical protein
MAPSAGAERATGGLVEIPPSGRRAPTEVRRHPVVNPYPPSDIRAQTYCGTGPSSAGRGTTVIVPFTSGSVVLV